VAAAGFIKKMNLPPHEQHEQISAHFSNITKNQKKTNRKVEEVEKVGRKAMKWSPFLRLRG
jgi:hypothetical protein